MARGTIAASRPMVVPTIARVKEISATIRMMNGIDRAMFTICPMTLFDRRRSAALRRGR
ncbi:hypothetical protein SANTM175S_00560 [Streptomyces antimycoticus]